MEFAHGGYRWRRKRWTYAEITHDRLISVGVPRDNIIMAPCAELETQRTRESALAVQQILSAQGLHPAALNIFTLGSHARRSQLVYAGVYGPSINIGVISWLPPGALSNPWWRSTARAKSLLTETIGYPYEALLDSGLRTTPKTVSLTIPSAAANEQM